MVAQLMPLVSVCGAMPLQPARIEGKRALKRVLKKNLLTAGFSLRNVV